MTDEEVIDISQHYNMLAREIMSRGGYYSLSLKHPKEHKNWKYFVKLLDTCNKNSWNPKQYLDFQFNHAKRYWKNNHFPLPSMIVSEKLVSFFRAWREEQDKFQEDNPKYNRNRSQKTYSSIYNEIISQVMKSAEKVDKHMKTYFSKRGFKNFQLVSEKMKYIVQNYWILSPYYLFTFRFIRNNPLRMIHSTSDYKYGYTDKSIKDIQHIFSILSSNKKMGETAIESRKEIEKTDSYYVSGSFNIFSKKASIRYYLDSLLKLGYTKEQIINIYKSSNRDSHSEIDQLNRGGHVSSLSILTARNIIELEEQEEQEEIESE